MVNAIAKAQRHSTLFYFQEYQIICYKLQRSMFIKHISDMK